MDYYDIWVEFYIGIIIEQLLLIPYSLTRLQDFDRVQILNGPQLINETSSDKQPSSENNDDVISLPSMYLNMSPNSASSIHARC